MWIRFTEDDDVLPLGRANFMQFHRKGTVANLPKHLALKCIEKGRAERTVNPRGRRRAQGS